MRVIQHGRKASQQSKTWKGALLPSLVLAAVTSCAQPKQIEVPVEKQVKVLIDEQKKKNALEIHNELLKTDQLEEFDKYYGLIDALSPLAKESSEIRKMIIDNHLDGLEGFDIFTLEELTHIMDKLILHGQEIWAEELIEMLDNPKEGNVQRKYLEEALAYNLRIVLRREWEFDPSYALKFSEIIWNEYSLDPFFNELFDFIHLWNNENQQKVLDEILAEKLTDSSSVLGLLLAASLDEEEKFKILAGYWHERIDNHDGEISGPMDIFLNMPVFIGDINLNFAKPLDDKKLMEQLGWYDRKSGKFTVFISEQVTLNISYGLTILSKEDLISVYKEFNVAFFMRYPPSVIRNLAEIANGKKPEGPLALLIYPKDDWNNTFYLNNSPLRTSHKSAYEYIIFEAGIDDKVFDFLSGFSDKYGQLSLLGFFGHGGIFGGSGIYVDGEVMYSSEDKGINLGGEVPPPLVYGFIADDAAIDTSDEDELTAVAKKLKLTEDAVIVVDSCKGGEKNGIGTMLEKIFKRTVLAVETSYNKMDFTYNEEGKITGLVIIGPTSSVPSP